MSTDTIPPRDFAADWKGRDADEKDLICQAAVVDTYSQHSLPVYELWEDIQGRSKYDGSGDRLLAAALDILTGHGMEDDQTGSVDELAHCARFGRFLLWTDDSGFVTVDKCSCEDAAKDQFLAFERELDGAESADGETVRTVDTFALTIKLGNAAMQDGFDISRALSAAGESIKSMGYDLHAENGPVRDDNGNTVGRWELS